MYESVEKYSQYYYMISDLKNIKNYYIRTIKDLIQSEKAKIFINVIKHL